MKSQSVKDFNIKPLIFLVCEKMEVDNGRVNGTGTEYGAVIYLECDTGYAIKGPNKLSCQDKGLWSDYPTCVIQSMQFALTS